VNSTWLITSELANQRARKAQFTCLVYTEIPYYFTFAMKGVIYYVTIAMVIFLLVKISCFHVKAHLVNYISVYTIYYFIFYMLLYNFFF